MAEELREKITRWHPRKIGIDQEDLLRLLAEMLERIAELEQQTGIERD